MLTRRRFIGQTIRAAILISAGNTLTSFLPGTFLLPDRKKIRLRFALASDGHYGQPKTDFAVTHANMVQWLNKEKQDRGLNFSVINGDLFHDKPELLPQVKQVWDGLSMPYYVSHGNHDKVPEEMWKNTFGYGWHHAFDLKDCGFLILNTADIDGKYICPDFSFAQHQLQQYAGKKHCFVFMHIAPAKWTPNAIECKGLTDLFAQQPNLKGIFHGHDHDQDGMKELGGKHYFFDSHIGGNWGTPYNGYRIVEVLKDGSIFTYQMNATASVQVNSNTI
ncbi:transcriptional regulator [Pseudoflavitalea sp. G-6-1-2]|uniref:metallophosphoesterase family protein n=1 Tax=Pseudoflavitalea sp. G-6-1-2 TaxID=2728841 RepID=UPI00146C4997|nr:metallophosphoesterase [Pseudoflavitalea sp. G-6-1-2]NML21790.1 transcriptional regulator [Pseudoflavitalea sp. G-6-1-2]